jgi:hypothetical protein
MTSFLKSILSHLCQPTLEMIGQDFTELPEFREGFFLLIENIIGYCTAGLFSLEV